MKPRVKMIDPHLSAYYVGDCRQLLKRIPSGTVQTCITSPPYWGLRDYGEDGQIGLEESPEIYIATMVKVFREVWRTLTKDGTLWLNLGDSYAGDPGGFNERRSRPAGRLKNSRSGKANSSRTFMAKTNFKKRGAGLKTKDLVGIPWEVALALRADGWYLRSDIIWEKPNPMPESVTDRPSRAHEYIFLLSKSEQYYYNGDAIREPLQPKTLTTYNSLRRSKGNDALGKVAADNWSKDVPVRKPKLDDEGNVLGASKRDVWTVDEIRPPQDDMFDPSSEPVDRVYGSGNNHRKLADGSDGERPNDHRGSGIPWTDEDGLRSKRSVWNVATVPYDGAHFATFPPKLIEPCILAGSRVGDLVLDPFFGSGVTGMVAEKHERRWIGLDISEKYALLAKQRTAQRSLPLARSMEAT